MSRHLRLIPSADDGAEGGAYSAARPVAAGRAAPSSIAQCRAEERVMHICGDPDECEATDRRPPVDLLGGGDE